MARGGRKRPLLSQQPPPSREDPEENGLDFDADDDIDHFIKARHDALDVSAGSDADGVPSADEPEVYERDVLPISDSDSSSDPDEDANADEDARDWGTRRKAWYGGDTHQYEIMSDEERDEALRDEEEEAIEMQKKALSNLRPEDYADTLVADDEKESDDGSDSSDEERDDHARDADRPEMAAPELPLLIQEAAHCEQMLAGLRQKVAKSNISALLFHLYASFLSNVAFYFALLTDPAAESVDHRMHPVIPRIVRIRALIEKARKAQEDGDVFHEDDRIDDDLSSKAIGLKNRVILTNLGKESPANGVNEEKPSKTKKKKKTKEKGEKKRKRALSNTEDADLQVQSVVQDDDAEVNALLGPHHEKNGNTKEDDEAEGRKRRKLNKLVGAMERERKNKEERRMSSADVDNIPKSKDEQFGGMPSSNGGMSDPAIEGDDDNDVDISLFDGGDHDADGDNGIDNDDDDVVRKMMRKKEKRDQRKARKTAEAAKPHVYTFDDHVDDDAKRKATSQVVHNRGLTRYRPRDKKTPRTRNRLAYGKAIKKRRSVVREYVGIPGPNYGGESTGINMAARKGSKLSSV